MSSVREAVGGFLEGSHGDRVYVRDEASHRALHHYAGLHCHRLVGSMGRVGAAGDNAAVESFFSLLQKNVLDRRRWATRDQLRIAIVRWIERTYHRRRRQDGLGKLTPVEYEAIMNPPMALAA